MDRHKVTLKFANVPDKIRGLGRVKVGNIITGRPRARLSQVVNPASRIAASGRTFCERFGDRFIPVSEVAR